MISAPRSKDYRRIQYHPKGIGEEQDYNRSTFALVSIMNRIVTYARVVVHFSQDAGGISENHWTVYLLLQDETSIRMNMTATEYGNPRGTLEWASYSYQLTNSAIDNWDYAMAEGVTLQMVSDLVYNWGRDQHQFSGGGSGCRYWR
jgi:hypothetical protein